jgi:hypothetical protein
MSSTLCYPIMEIYLKIYLIFIQDGSILSKTGVQFLTTIKIRSYWLLNMLTYNELFKEVVNHSKMFIKMVEFVSYINTFKNK